MRIEHTVMMEELEGRVEVDAFVSFVASRALAGLMEEEEREVPGLFAILVRRGEGLREGYPIVEETETESTGTCSEEEEEQEETPMEEMPQWREPLPANIYKVQPMHATALTSQA